MPPCQGYHGAVTSRNTPITPAATPHSPARGVYEVLSQSRAKLQRSAALGDALQLAQWHNSYDHTRYQHPGHHTLSVYVSGGQRTRFLGQSDVNVGERGGPGRYCVLPAEHESGWAIDELFSFVHLYVSAQAWADRVVRLLDAEPRTHTLERRIFGQDHVLAQWAQNVTELDWSQPHHRLQAHAASHHALDHLVLLAATPRQRQAAERVTGGLSASTRRRVLDHMRSHLTHGADGELHLARLAELANLSEFHFARMFRLSMGCSVHVWVVQQRMALAGRLPKAIVQLEILAASCIRAGGTAAPSTLRAPLKRLVQ